MVCQLRLRASAVCVFLRHAVEETEQCQDIKGGVEYTGDVSHSLLSDNLTLRSDVFSDVFWLWNFPFALTILSSFFICFGCHRSSWPTCSKFITFCPSSAYGSYVGCLFWKSIRKQERAIVSLWEELIAWDPLVWLQHNWLGHHIFGSCYLSVYFVLWFPFSLGWFSWVRKCIFFLLWCH